MKRRILEATAASASSSSSAAPLPQQQLGGEPVPKRPRYDDYASFSDIATLEANMLRVQNTELFAKLQQQKGEVARLREELGVREAAARAWQRHCLDIEHSVTQFHDVVQSLLPSIVSAQRPSGASSAGTEGGVRSLLTLLASSSSSSSSSTPLSDTQLEAATRSVQTVTQDARELLSRLVEAVQAHVSPAPTDEVAHLRATLNDALSRAVRAEEELQRLQRRPDPHDDLARERERRADAEERLEREQRNLHRLQLQLHQQQEQFERQLREAQRMQQQRALIPDGATNGSAAGSEEARAEQQGIQDVLTLRQEALEQLRAEKAALARQLETERAEWTAQLTGPAWEERVRQSAVYRAQEVRWADAQAREASARAEAEEARAELQAVLQQRRHDAEQRTRLHQAQLVTQEEKIAAMETRLKKLQHERDTLAHELEQRRADKPAPQLLRQLTDELSAQTQRAQEALEQKSAFLERIAELRRTIARLEKSADPSSSVAELQQRLETQERENETLLSEMSQMEAELTRVQQENTRLLRSLAEGEEARLHHTLERAAWTKQQQTAARKGELERDKIAKCEERLRAQEATLQQWHNKASSLEQQLRTKQDELALWQQRAELAEKTHADLALLAQDLAQRMEETQATLQQLQQRALAETEQTTQLQREIQTLKEELALATRRAQVQGGGKLKGSGSSESYVEQQLEAYKRLVRCSVCNDRNKSCVITRCYHCFCKECIEDNLEKRIRKCPGCGISFGDKDVHAIWF